MRRPTFPPAGGVPHVTNLVENQLRIIYAQACILSTNVEYVDHVFSLIMAIMSTLKPYLSLYFQSLLNPQRLWEHYLLQVV